jgi:hypothetical protein
VISGHLEGREHVGPYPLVRNEPRLVNNTLKLYNLQVIIRLMRIQAGREFGTWFAHVKKEGGVLLARTADLLAALRELQGKPIEESATFKRVRQARRHEIWRVAHPFDPEVAVRILCWFPEQEPGSVVVALVGGDKKVIQDLWYDSATPRAEAVVDQWIRQQSTPS